MENQAMALLESGKRLTADEEVIVFRYYHEHTTPEMRNQIALNNLGLVHSVINNYTYSGIPAEELDKIFERFYKVDTFTQGTGLGLSICKSIAEQMGAQIGVDSAVGEGSCFRVEMPIAE